MQMALAMSASDPYSKEDPETAQIKAAKQISLGVAPSRSPDEFLSLRYWTYNVINYDEKIMDGFYDVNGINSNPTMQGRMPLLVDLAAVPILDNHNHEVIIVNREDDVGLRDVEERAVLIYRECLSLRKGLSRNLLVQKIADLVANRMGGPVTDAEEISKRWTARSYDLKVSLETIVLPLGCLDIGHSRHRALLFKVLADKINLPCMLVKGSYYTGTDDGAVNMIKFDNGSEYIIDLMGAPGTLIPAEVSSIQLPTSNMRDVSTVTDNPISSHSSASGPPSMSHTTGDPKISQLMEDLAFHSIEPKRGSGTVLGNVEVQKPWHDVGNASSLSVQQSLVANKASTAERKQVNDISEYVISASKDPEFAKKLHDVLLESGAAPPRDLLSSIGSDRYGEQNQLMAHTGDCSKSCSEMSNNEWALMSLTREHLLPSPFDKNGREPHRNVLAKPEHSGKETTLAAYQSVSTSSSVDAGKNPENQVSNTSNGVVNDDPTTLRNDQIDKILEAVAEWEIPWEALQIAERVGIGSYGEVYRAEWNGTEVAVKRFMNQDMSSNALALFKCEVEIMSRLRHPNVVLFMGAVTRPPNLSILTEFLPRSVSIHIFRHIIKRLKVLIGIQYVDLPLIVIVLHPLSYCV
ncbi:hypothetical protein Leryth_000570 [Lithospermum erythrorhizon]|nr:hypothetical protein Leryth_000570 [Lithospermum erythrorhizon]